jgi:hypothetical protein
MFQSTKFVSKNTFRNKKIRLDDKLLSKYLLTVCLMEKRGNNVYEMEIQNCDFFWKAIRDFVELKIKVKFIKS